MKGHWPFFKLMILLSLGHSSADHCDRASTALVREGNLGQSGDFNWLGVLHVRLHELIATSGIVLIKIQYALVNADDVARIPQHIFKSNSRAMFFATRDTPWFVKPASYVTHPEYEDSMINSIAVIELDLEDVEDFPLTPICVSTTSTFDASKYLYLSGITHENETLDKVIYKVQYLDKKVCEEFYKREEFSLQKLIPSAYLCGYSPNSATHCVWDNGMTLVSNSFGYLNLVGFSVHGPGCAAPARFIDLFPYFKWIHSITVKSDYGTKEFIPKNRRKKPNPDIPIHELYTMKGSRRQLRQNPINHQFESYPYQLTESQFHLERPTKDKNTVLIIPSKRWQKFRKACRKATEIIYREIFELNAVDKIMGSATYKLSLYDQDQSECVCVRLTVECKNSSNAILTFKEDINFKEDIRLDGLVTGGETPVELFRDFPVPQRTEKPIDKMEELLQSSFIHDHYVLNKTVKNYDLYIKFDFFERAKLQFEMLAEPPKITTTTEVQLKPRRMAETRVKAKTKSRWGIDNWADNMLREDDVSVIEEEMHDTQSAARGELALGAAVMAGWLIVCLSRATFIQ